MATRVRRGVTGSHSGRFMGHGRVTPAQATPSIGPHQTANDQPRQQHTSNMKRTWTNRRQVTS